MAAIRTSSRAGSRLALLATACTVVFLSLFYLLAARRPATLRGHSLEFQRIDGGLPRLVSSDLGTATGKSLLVAGIGRGDFHGFESAPQSNAEHGALTIIDSAHTYARWPSSGTALYWATVPAGTAASVTIATAPADEITMAAVHIDGERIQDHSWVERPPAWRITSGKVRTTGPATLVAFWWGDAGVRHRKHVFAGNGFKLVDSVLESGALVQAAVAVKHVSRAGSYDVTWAAWPKQGGQLWLIAVQ